MRWLRTSALAIAVVTAADAAVSGPTAAAEPIAVTATIARAQEGRLLLEFNLRSRTKEVLRLPAELLPWGSPRYALVMAVDASGHALTDAHGVLAGIVGSPVVELQPGQVLRGYVDLDERFPEIRKWLSRGDVVVLWSFRPAAINAARGRRLAGALVLPR